MLAKRGSSSTNNDMTCLRGNVVSARYSQRSQFELRKRAYLPDGPAEDLAPIWRDQEHPF